MKKLFAWMLAAVVATAGIAGVATAQSAGSGSSGQSGSSSSDKGGDSGAPQRGTMHGAATGTMPGSGSSTTGTMPGSSTTPGTSSTIAEDQETIRQAQAQLKAAGFTPGPSDGIMDDQTRSAIRQFQQSKGLKVTGQLDQETLAALRSGVGAQTPGSQVK